jgi:hypothetical protein
VILAKSEFEFSREALIQEPSDFRVDNQSLAGKERCLHHEGAKCNRE